MIAGDATLVLAGLLMEPYLLAHNSSNLDGQDMASANGSAKLTIDEKEYDIGALSEEAKAQLASVQAVDRRLAKLKEEAAILQTARIAYSNALRDLLPEQ